jgi:hypothetical protein
VKLFGRKRPNALERVLTLSDDTEKARHRRSLADQCVRFRTRSGRIAHLVHADYGVLCGQRGASFAPEPGNVTCRLCEARLAELTGEQPGEQVAS